MQVNQFLNGMDNKTPVPPTPLSRPPENPPARRRNILEILLDPRSIQWLLASGGGLLTVGLIIWLASLGVFKNPRVIAFVLGAGTIAILEFGWFTTRCSRYQMAGRAMTLLACLVMPLNLWFYHAHHMLTLEGNLWMAALVCCVFYAASAWVLRDRTFVYVLMAGVAMTGLLILADMHALAQIAAPATLLVVLGLIGIHAERAFADDDGLFSRQRFGLAFFWSGHVLMAAGLLMVMGARIAGLFWEPLSQFWHLAERPAIVVQHSLKLLILGLVIGAAYAYLYSDLVVRRVGWYVYAAACMLLWSEVIAVDVLHLSYSANVMILVASGTALLINLCDAFIWRGKAMARPVAPLGLLLGVLPVLLGITLHFRATQAGLHGIWPFHITWTYVLAMFVAAATCRISAYVNRHGDFWWVPPHLIASAAALLVALAGLLWVLGVQSWAAQAPLMMLVPIAYLLAGHIESGPRVRDTWSGVAHIGTFVMIASVLGSALEITPRVVQPVVGHHINLLLAAFTAEAAIFFGLTSLYRRHAFGIFAATVMASGALWQLLNYWSVSSDYYTLAYAVAGLVLLTAQRLLAARTPEPEGWSVAAFQSANTLMMLSFISAVLITLGRLAGGQGRTLVLLPAMLAGLSLLAAALVPVQGLRRSYTVLAIIEGALALLVLQTRLNLTAVQNLEVFSVAAGLIVLISGHIGWYREQEKQDSGGVSFGLAAGSLLVGVPLFIAVLVHRLGDTISLPDELGLLTASVLMFVTGIPLRIRATTLTGGSLLILHVAILLVFAGMRAQLALGVYLAAGGAMIFALGLLLSVYREKLLALPQRIRDKAGVFQVLAWR